ncbi:Uma2 family endonuclease [Spirulina sp. CS-785/01]|uniref:Uma2 family endonuclease n=1 Tax=Spirulina sp. CS-785/01 TaxID=3021716 RepID=UPI00232EBE39|nr:Uma2 family endonuclease [Spirulina sp. CS-785/01]MDB9314766.1 Uma2 family endonuclease [Spirulina sp. CS-785/01]
MSVLTPIQQINLRPGSRITIPHLSWPDFEAILEELGEKRTLRLAYCENNLELMTPSPEHERAKIVIADLVKVVLRVQGRAWEALGSTTFKRQTMQAGIEPDECFYIANYQAVIGKDRLDLDIDPPPDLAIESDVTSLTAITAYQRLGVPELWVYSNPQLTIYVLQGEEYQETAFSPNFPDVNIQEAVLEVLQRAREIGSSLALQEFEESLRGD